MQVGDAGVAIFLSRLRLLPFPGLQELLVEFKAATQLLFPQWGVCEIIAFLER